MLRSKENSVLRKEKKQQYSKSLFYAAGFDLKTCTVVPITSKICNFQDTLNNEYEEKNVLENLKKEFL